MQEFPQCYFTGCTAGGGAGRHRCRLAPARSLCLKASLHLLDELVDAEARGPLTRWIFLEGSQKWAHEGLRREEWGRTVAHEPVVVGVRRNVGALVGVRPQVEEFRDAQLGKRLGPDSHRALRALLLEDNLPVFIAQGHDIAIVVEVEKF